MKLWLISQTVNSSYDTYDSAVVAAETAEEAQCVSPEADYNSSGLRIIPCKPSSHYYNAWVNDPLLVKVKEIGEALPGTPKSIILASFNAG